MPGKMRYIGSTWTHEIASEIERPHDGVGGLTPTPRKDRAASAPILPGIETVVKTMTVAAMFGTISRTMMRADPVPLCGGGTDEAAFAQGQGLAADDAGDLRPPEEADDEDEEERAREARGHGGRERDREDEEREAEDDVGQAREETVGDSAEEAGDEPDRDPDGHGHDRRGEPDEEGDLGAVGDDREEVPARARFDPEPVPRTHPAQRPRRCRVRTEEIGVVRVGAVAGQPREDRGEDGEEDEENDESEADHRGA